MAPKAKRTSDEADPLAKEPKAKKAKAVSPLEGLTISAFLKYAPTITATFTWPGLEEPIVIEIEPTKNKSETIGWGYTGKLELPVTVDGKEYVLPTNDSLNLTISKSKGLEPGSDVEEEGEGDQEEAQDEEEEKPKAKGKAKKASKKK